MYNYEERQQWDSFSALRTCKIGHLQLLWLINFSHKKIRIFLKSLNLLPPFPPHQILLNIPSVSASQLTFYIFESTIISWQWSEFCSESILFDSCTAYDISSCMCVYECMCLSVCIDVCIRVFLAFKV